MFLKQKIIRIRKNPRTLLALIDIAKGPTRCVMLAEFENIGDLLPSQKIKMKQDDFAIVIELLPTKTGHYWTYSTWIEKSIKYFLASNDAIYGD